MSAASAIRRNAHPILWLPFYAYKYLVVIPILLLSTLFFGTVIILMCIAGYPDTASRWFATAWAKVNAVVTRLAVRVHGRENLAPGQSYVVVANHQSLLDIYAIYGYSGLDLKWVMKQELRAVPVLGAACEKMGHIFIDRSNTEAALASINDARDKVKDGMCVVFFPEGTRSRDGDLARFKKGAFRLAIELQLPVLPVSIEGTRNVLPSDTMDWYPGSGDMRIHPAIETTGMTPSDLNALTEQAQTVIAEGLKRDAAN